MLGSCSAHPIHSRSALLAMCSLPGAPRSGVGPADFKQVLRLPAPPPKRQKLSGSHLHVQEPAPEPAPFEPPHVDTETEEALEEAVPGAINDTLAALQLLRSRFPSEVRLGSSAAAAALPPLLPFRLHILHSSQPSRPCRPAWRPLPPRPSFTRCSATAPPWTASWRSCAGARSLRKEEAGVNASHLHDAPRWGAAASRPPLQPHPAPHPLLPSRPAPPRKSSSNAVRLLQLPAGKDEYAILLTEDYCATLRRACAEVQAGSADGGGANTQSAAAAAVAAGAARVFGWMESRVLPACTQVMVTHAELVGLLGGGSGGGSSGGRGGGGGSRPAAAGVAARR